VQRSGDDVEPAELIAAASDGARDGFLLGHVTAQVERPGNRLAAQIEHRDRAPSARKSSPSPARCRCRHRDESPFALVGAPRAERYRRPGEEAMSRVKLLGRGASGGRWLLGTIRFRGGWRPTLAMSLTGRCSVGA